MANRAYDLRNREEVHEAYGKILNGKRQSDISFSFSPFIHSWIRRGRDSLNFSHGIVAAALQKVLVELIYLTGWNNGLDVVVFVPFHFMRIRNNIGRMLLNELHNYISLSSLVCRTSHISERANSTNPMFVRFDAYNDKKCSIELRRPVQWDGLSQRACEKLDMSLRI